MIVRDSTITVINNRMGRMSLRMGAIEVGSEVWEWSMESLEVAL